MFVFHDIFFELLPFGDLVLYELITNGSKKVLTQKQTFFKIKYERLKMRVNTERSILQPVIPLRIPEINLK
ncbi:hypothetical protein DXD68_09430 [Parabacteroides sp. TM07-1AC]|nr:hypothetical protein DXD68_09430 [Parabacteroides sp. TM07-1AC]